MGEREEKRIHLLDYWRVLVKRRWIAYTSVSVLVATVGLGSLVVDPTYQATTRLQIERSAPNILPFQEVVSSTPDLRNDFHQTQFGLIQSRTIAREVIRSLELERHEEFRVQAPGGLEEETRAEAYLDGRRIDRFLERLEVAPVRNSRLVDITFASGDPELAAKVANRVAETYIAFNTEAKYNTSERATTSLTLQVANLQEGIDRKEKELQEYAREQDIVPLSENQNITLKNLNAQNDAYVRARAARIEKEAVYEALRQSEPDDLAEVRESKLVQELAAKLSDLERRRALLSESYKSDWPEMVGLEREIEETRRQLRQERGAIYEQVLGEARGAHQAARNEEDSLRAAVEEQKQEFQGFRLLEIRYNNLKAEIANRRATLEALVKRQSETASSIGVSDLVASNVRIVDPAEVPSSPSAPKLGWNLLLSLLAGTFLGVGLAFFFEYLDKSVKTPEEVHQVSQVPCLGMIPSHLPNGTRLRLVNGNRQAGGVAAGVETISHENPKSKISEAFREVRTALLLSRPGRPPRTILVTSAQSGEGKTAVSLNLAIALAQIGRRVLLIDTDLRKPRLHRLLGVADGQGLSHWLGGLGAVGVEPCRTGIPKLDLIPSGPAPPNPADLLESERLVELQKKLEADGYDHILYDSPPVLAVADPAIIAGHVEGVVVVVQAGVTGRDVLEHAVGKLRQVNAPILGTVLNQADLALHGYYGYGTKRFYREDDAEVPPQVPAVRLRASGEDAADLG